jgi:hypothetical protein
MIFGLEGRVWLPQKPEAAPDPVAKKKGEMGEQAVADAQPLSAQRRGQLNTRAHRNFLGEAGEAGEKFNGKIRVGPDHQCDVPAAAALPAPKPDCSVPADELARVGARRWDCGAAEVAALTQEGVDAYMKTALDYVAGLRVDDALDVLCAAGFNTGAALARLRDPAAVRAPHVLDVASLDGWSNAERAKFTRAISKVAA